MEYHQTDPSSRLLIAPMLGYTHSHYRYLLRLIAGEKLFLYTEMIVAQALLHTISSPYLAYDPTEKPLGVQLAGSDPKLLAQCAKIVAKKEINEINLNAGCPSERVQAGGFGACLLNQPELLRDCFLAMQNAVDIPVSIKTRLGIIGGKSLEDSIEMLAKAGCRKFIIHARKANLEGLSPKKNRKLPPIDYQAVYALKIKYPDLIIILNGEIHTTGEIHTHLEHIDGVMIGRMALKNPYFFAQFHPAIPSREEIIQQYLPYAERQLKNGASKSLLLQPLQGLYHGTPSAKKWRQQAMELL